MFRSRVLSLALAISLCVIVVPAGAKPKARRDDDRFGMLDNNQGKSPCALVQTLQSSCQLQVVNLVNSNPVPNQCTCNNVFFNIWSACLLQRNEDLQTLDKWETGCKNASLNLTDGYEDVVYLDIPMWAFMRVPDDGKFNVNNVRAVISNNNPASQHWSIIQIIAPVISSVGTLVLVGVIILLYRAKSTNKRNPSKNTWDWRIPCLRRAHKVRRVTPKDKDNWTIDQIPNENEPVEIGLTDYPVPSLGFLAHIDQELGPPVPQKPEWHLPGKGIWKRPLQIPSKIPIPWKDRAIPVQSVPPTGRFRIGSTDHSTLYGTPKGSIDGHRASTFNKFSTEGVNGGSSRAHETIEEEDDEDEDTSLISPGARSENHVFLISRPGRESGFTVGSKTSTSRTTSHQVHVQPPTPSTLSNHSPIALRSFRPKLPSHIPPPPTKPAPSPPIVTPRVPPQLQLSLESQSHQPVASTSQIMDTHVPQISQPPLSISRPRSSESSYTGPHHTQLQRQLSTENDDTYHQQNFQTTRKPGGARPNLTTVSSKESLQGAFSNPQYSSQAHHRQLSDSAARRSPLHWHDEVYQSGSSPSFVHRELSIEEETSRSTLSHHLGIAGPSSQLPRTPTPIPHRRGHSADDATSNNQSIYHHSPSSHIRNLSTENIIPSRSDPVNLFPGPVRATGYPRSQSGATESSASLYSNSSYPIQPPNVAYPPHRS